MLINQNILYTGRGYMLHVAHFDKTHIGFASLWEIKIHRGFFAEMERG